ncbi:MAG TPA: O-antigen ligase family protein [Candidatus Omnitrophota bacterium]|nr:O-antigen ligase family protein [Candidatus Omnitrophota bacterium]
MPGLLVLLAVIGGVVILVNPFFGLLATIVLFPQALIPSMGYSFLGAFSMMTPIKIIGVLMFLGTLIKVVSKGSKLSFLRKGGFLYYTLYLVYLYINGFSQPTAFSRELFTSFTSFWIFGFSILVLITTPQRFRIVVITAILSFVAAAAQSVINFLTHPDYLAMTARLQGTNFDPNYFAISLLPVIVMSFYVGLAEKRFFWKIILLGTPIILLAALILTQSRGGLLGLAVMLLFAVFRAKNKFLGLLTVGIVSLALVYVMPDSVWERFEKTKIEDTYDDTIGSTVRRYYLAMAAWEMYLDNPVFGSGPGDFYYNCRLYYPLKAGRAHTMYLEIMAEMGTIGIGLFLAVLFSALRSAGRAIKQGECYGSYGRGLWLGLIGFMVSAFFLHAQQEKILWLIVFLSFAIERLALAQPSGSKLKSKQRGIKE